MLQIYVAEIFNVEISNKATRYNAFNGAVPIEHNNCIKIATGGHYFLSTQKIISSKGNCENTKKYTQFNITFRLPTIVTRVRHSLNAKLLYWHDSHGWPSYVRRLHRAVPAILKKLDLCILGIMGLNLWHLGVAQWPLLLTWINLNPSMDK